MTAEPKMSMTEGVAYAVQQGRQIERHRVAATLALPEAGGRERLALQLLATTDLSVDQIRASLVGAAGGVRESADLWSQVLESRGMAVQGGAAQSSGWDDVLAARGMQVG